MHLLAEEDERRMAAYLATNSDREAAELLGVLPGTFYAWRCRRDLPNRREATGGREAEHQRRLETYKESASDAEVAERGGLKEKVPALGGC